jgi:hypothetical protein
VGYEFVEVLEREIRLAPDVAELEAGVVVARVLVVDEPEAVADVDEVLGEEVVVAGDGTFVAHGHRLPDSPHVRPVVEVALGKPEAALLHQLEVARLDLEHVEVVAEAPCSVELAAGRCDPAQLVAAPQVLGCLRLSLDELEDEDAAFREVSDDVGADPGLGRGDRVVVLVFPVDGEETRVLGGDPNDICLPVRLDLVVRVREPARELGDGVGTRKLGDELKNLFDLRGAAHVA